MPLGVVAHDDADGEEHRQDGTGADHFPETRWIAFTIFSAPPV